MKLIDGKKTAQDIRAEIKEEVASRTAQGVRAPGLAVILVALAVFAAVLIISGAALLVLAWKTWKKGREDQDQNPVDLESQEAEAKSEEQGPKT